MGTSHRHKLGVVGQPNWGSVSSSITGLANGVAESDMLDNNPPSNMTSQQKSKRQSIIGMRINKNYHQWGRIADKYRDVSGFFTAGRSCRYRGGGR